MLCFQKHGHFIPSLNLTTFAWPSFKTQQWCKHKHKRSEANSTYLTFLHSVKKKREKGRVVNQSKLVITYHLSNKTDNVQWDMFMWLLLPWKSDSSWVLWACLFFALVIWYANCICSMQYYIVICGMSGCTIFLHIFIKKKYWTWNVCFDFLYQCFFWNISCVKYVLFLSQFNQTSIFLTYFWKFHIKILWKSVQWGWVILCGQTDGEIWWKLQSLFAILWTHLKICCGSGTEVGQPASSGVPRLPHYECYKRYEKFGLIKSETFYLTPLLSCPWNCFYDYNWTCIQVCSFMQMCFDHMGHHQFSSK